MLSLLFPISLRRNPEFQSAWVRMAIWIFSATYIGLGIWTDYYAVNVVHYFLFFGFYFLIFLGLLISVYLIPEARVRRYLTLATDVSATSLAIFLTQEAISPFYLLYIWIFVSYGTRYGKHSLRVASILSILAYNVVLIALNEWQRHTFEAFFFLLLLAVLPLYQYSLLRKVHEARREAERANQARGDFLATMTHELRTPLIGVIGMTRLLQTTPLDAEQQEYLHSIKSSAQLLRSLIGDILDFSKIDANKLELEQAPFDIRELVIGINSALAVEAQEKHIELLCQVDSAVPRELVGDKLRVSQILFNLLGNAIKFTDRGVVRLSLSVQPASEEVAVAHLLLEVKDTGVGIPPEKLEKIFDMFWQADASASSRFGGSGLGTTVARDLCHNMGGWIGVSSRQGEGSTFSVRLPLLPKEGGSLNVRPPRLAGRRLLLFETNPASLEVELDAATELGMDVVPVGSLEALNSLAESGFDLVLVCDSLSGIPLAEVSEQLKVLVAPEVPILFAGYRGHLPPLPDAFSAQLLKPFIADQLAQAVLKQFEPGADRKGALEQEAGVSESGIRILLAEDNAIAAKVLQTLLTRKGHQVVMAKDGEEALDAASRGGFHLAFIDLRMPRMDGLEFTRRFRALEPEAMHMPILALTANSAEDVLAQCQAVGMDGFLNKPAEPDQLDSVIARYVRTPSYGFDIA
jgi:two-component system sensor histidine kinase RpfC